MDANACVIDIPGRGAQLAPAERSNAAAAEFAKDGGILTPNAALASNSAAHTIGGRIVISGDVCRRQT